MNCNIPDIHSQLGFKWMSIFLESHLVLCYKTIDPVNLLVEICPKQMNVDVDKDSRTMIFMAVLFVIVQNWKQFKVNNMENA